MKKKYKLYLRPHLDWYVWILTLPSVYSSKGNTKCKVLVTSFHLNWLELVQNHS